MASNPILPRRDREIAIAAKLAQDHAEQAELMANRVQLTWHQERALSTMWAQVALAWDKVPPIQVQPNR